MPLLRGEIEWLARLGYVLKGKSLARRTRDVKNYMGYVNFFRASDITWATPSPFKKGYVRLKKEMSEKTSEIFLRDLPKHEFLKGFY